MRTKDLIALRRALRDMKTVSDLGLSDLECSASEAVIRVNREQYELNRYELNRELERGTRYRD